jgi:hypothetical protein
MSGRRGVRVHYGHCFHPAGHGTFFSGQVRTDEPGRKEFVWVYDCGSKRFKHLNGLVEQFSGSIGRNELDLVCVSHFDADHVCGIEALLRKFRVKKLVLPYLSLEMRLRHACQLRGNGDQWERLSAVFQLAPGAFLARRGLAERYEELVLIEGGEGAVDADERSEPALGAPDAPVDLEIPGAAEVDERVVRDDESALTVSHRTPWRLGDIYEFCFYNRELPDAAHLAPVWSIDDVRTEVARVLEAYDLFGDAPPRQGWLREIRRIYSAHFGALKMASNDISLSVLARPLLRGPFRNCEIFGRSVPCASNPVGGGVLLSGDLKLDGNGLDKLINHFGSRWSLVDCMQIPHHGSAHSWSPRNAEKCRHRTSVICAPGEGSRFPSEAVRDDLKGTLVRLADYSNAVCFEFHGSR